MGNIMQATFGRDPEITPFQNEEPTFDPHLGFKKGRKERVMPLTEDEMRAARIPQEFRDYCAHHWLKLEQCRWYAMPWTIKCAAEKHAWDVCYYEDYTLRMKEYERERRLRVRKKQVLDAQKAAAA